MQKQIFRTSFITWISCMAPLFQYDSSCLVWRCIAPEWWVIHNNSEYTWDQSRKLTPSILKIDDERGEDAATSRARRSRSVINAAMISAMAKHRSLLGYAGPSLVSRISKKIDYCVTGKRERENEGSSSGCPRCSRKKLSSIVLHLGLGL